MRAVPVFDDPDDVGAPLMHEVRPFGTETEVRAVNDAPYDGSTYTEDVDAWARHATATSGFGDADEPSLSMTYDLYRWARASRAGFVYGLVARFARRVAGSVRQSAARLMRRRQATDTRFALDALDDRTLHDLGFHRTEIGSIAAEATGQAERTRVRFRTSAADAFGARSFL